MSASENRPVIQWTPSKLKELEHAYAEAVRSGKEVFKYEGHPFLVSYAKYLIEYLSSYFQQHGGGHATQGAK